jgi:hypothetical protein
MNNNWMVIILILAIGIGGFFIISNQKVQTQAVVGVDCPLFKTNAGLFTNNYYNTDSWIATDCNNDGNYEAYGYLTRTQSYFVNNSAMLKTPDNYDYYCDLVQNRLVVRVTSSIYVQAVYQINAGNYAAADLTCNSVCVPNCVGKCGGVSDGCSGTCSNPCSCTCSGTMFICDGDSDGRISKSELANTAQKWIMG